jgi:hypothetical protein
VTSKGSIRRGARVERTLADASLDADERAATIEVVTRRAASLQR